MADYIPLIERVSNKTFNSIDDTDLVLIPDSSYENFDAVRLIDIKKYILDDYQLNIPGVEGNVVKLGANKKLVDSGFTLGTSVPADAKFTDTIYDDTELKEKISKVQSELIENYVTKDQLTDIKIVNELPEDAEDYPNTIFIVVDSE